MVVHRIRCCRHHSMLWYIHAIRTYCITTSIRGEWRQKKLLSPQTNMRNTNVCAHEKRKVCICSAIFSLLLLSDAWLSIVCNQWNCCFWMKEAENDQENFFHSMWIAIVIWSLIFMPFFFFRSCSFCNFSKVFCYCGQKCIVRGSCSLFIFKLQYKNGKENCCFGWPLLTVCASEFTISFSAFHIRFDLFCCAAKTKRSRSDCVNTASR